MRSYSGTTIPTSPVCADSILQPDYSPHARLERMGSGRSVIRFGAFSRRLADGPRLARQDNDLVEIAVLEGRVRNETPCQCPFTGIHNAVPAVGWSEDFAQNVVGDQDGFTAARSAGPDRLDLVIGELPFGIARSAGFRHELLYHRAWVVADLTRPFFPEGICYTRLLSDFDGKPNR